MLPELGSRIAGMDFSPSFAAAATLPWRHLREIAEFSEKVLELLRRCSQWGNALNKEADPSRV
jgi:hypothetical protein